MVARGWGKVVDSGSERFRGTRFLLELGAYLFAVFLGGALLAPMLHALVGWGDRIGLPLGRIKDAPFHIYVSRALLILAFLGMWPLVRRAGIRTWADLGWGKNPTGPRELGFGFTLGLASLLLAALLVLTAGGRLLDTDRAPEAILRHLVNAGLAGLLVSILEETLFRGALLGALQRATSPTVALAFSSALYAILHFFQRPPEPDSIRWSSGLLALGSMTRGFLDLPSLVPGFLNLTLAGFILGTAYQRTRSLWFPIGLHAGWIFWVKTYGFLTTDAPGIDAWFWGSRRLTDGWAALVVLLPIAWLLTRRQSASEGERDDPESSQPSQNLA